MATTSNGDGGHTETVLFETWQQLEAQTLGKVTIVMLKTALRQHGIKFKANSKKLDMFNNLFRHLYESSHPCIDTTIAAVTKIQSLYRGWKVRHIVDTRGVAALDIGLCNNEVDPITMEDLTDVPRTQLFSFQDTVDGKIYGFDVKPFWKWVQSGNESNPFTRNPLSDTTKEKLVKCWETSCMYSAAPETDDVSRIWTVTEKAFDLFHSIYILTGNFVDEAWFLQLDRIDLMRMYRVLHDIWMCQIDMSMEERLRFSPLDRPVLVHLYEVCFKRKYNFKKLQEVMLGDLDRMLSNPADKQDKCTAAMWILISMTMVSNQAARMLPHLTQTFY